MAVLRFLFLLAVATCVAVVAGWGQWQGRLRYGNHTWIIELPRAPLWGPPALPAHEEFQRTFESIPVGDTEGFVISRVLMWDWMLLELLLYLWPVASLFGALYLATRGKRRDILFHAVLGAAIGLTAGAGACVGLWLVFGGWGPPFPEWFGVAGLVAGVCAALLHWDVGKVA